MILWINGAFGAGKTTLVERLAPRLPDAMVFDPEEVGLLLGRLVPPSPTGDFQDLPIWRDLVVHTMLELRRHYGGNLIVPMTLVNPTYLDEIFGELRDNGEDLIQFFISVPADVLRQRITDQVLIPHDAAADAHAREWRLAQVERCVAAMSALPDDTEFLDWQANTPDELVTRVLVSLDLILREYRPVREEIDEPQPVALVGRPGHATRARAPSPGFFGQPMYRDVRDEASRDVARGD